MRAPSVLAFIAMAVPAVAQVPDGIREFKLLTPTQGWFLKASRLYASDLWGMDGSPSSNNPVRQ